MRYLFIILLFLLASCSIKIHTNQLTQKNSNLNPGISLKDELNESIIEGFYNNDTVGISKTIYLVK